MKIKNLFLVAILVAAIVPSAAVAQETTLKTKIDPGAELITIMMWVAGRYPMPMDSKYKSDVWARFGKYKDHPTLKRMKDTQMYPDFTEMGLLMSGFPDVKIDMPETNKWYEKKEGKDHIVGIMNDAREFARVTGYWKFYQKNLAEFARMEKEFADDLKAKDALAPVESFFRIADKPGRRPQVTIYMEPLNNWGAHAINYERLRGEPNGDRVEFQIGPVEQDTQLPDSPIKFSATRQTVQNVWHESSHVFLKKALDDNKDRIEKLVRLFNAPALESQNIKTWDYALEENIVRAIVAVITKQKFGDEAGNREIAGQTQRGFIYAKEIAELIEGKYVTGTQNFDDFMPTILTMLETKQGPADAKK